MLTPTPTLTLTEEEMMTIALQAVTRHVVNVISGRQDRYGHIGLGFDAHITGALGEYAVARFLDVAWDYLPKDTLDSPGDVVDGLQVRTTTRPDGSLIIHENDAPYHRYILAIVKLPIVKLMGWCYGHEGQNPTYWRTYQRPAFFVPATDLRPCRGARQTLLAPIEETS